MLDRNDFKIKKPRISETGKIAIILVSKANADSTENASVFLNVGFSRKLNPAYILMIVNERKKISCEL